MTRMQRKCIAHAPVVLFTLMCGVGCGPSEKDKKIQDLMAENDQLKNELMDRDRRLNDAMIRDNEARSTIDELNRELAQYRAAGGKPTKNTDGWITMPSFDMISVPGSVLFDSGKAVLTSRGRSTLAKIADDIRSRYSDRDIYVFGHTDNDPIRKSKWKDNWELGAQRSLTVVRTLRELGLANETLVQANCGEYRPKASNNSKDGKLQNRRVEFYAVKRSSGVIDANTAARSDESGE